MDSIDLTTAKGRERVPAEIFGIWAVHLTDEISKERYSVSHVESGRWGIQNLDQARARKLADALNMRYPSVSGENPTENIQIAAFCQGFVAPEGALRRSLSRRA